MKFALVAACLAGIGLAAPLQQEDPSSSLPDIAGLRLDKALTPQLKVLLGKSGILNNILNPLLDALLRGQETLIPVPANKTASNSPLSTVAGLKLNQALVPQLKTILGNEGLLNGLLNPLLDLLLKGDDDILSSAPGSAPAKFN